MSDSLLRASVVEFIRGGQAAVTFERALEGISPEHRNVKPAKDLHSIWEEAEHMRLAQEDILRYTLDAAWKSPKFPEGYWPTEASRLTDQIWDATLAGFLSDREELIKLAGNETIDLTSKIPHGEWRTYLRELLLAADHNSYHLGQIVQTRRLLGSWHG